MWALRLLFEEHHDHEHHDHEHHDHEEDDFYHRMLFGLLLTLAASLATSIGASIVYCRPLLVLAKKKFLSAALAFASGVLIYFSLVDILHHSAESFACPHEHHAEEHETHAEEHEAHPEECEVSETMGQIYALLSFVLGVGLMLLMHYIVHKLLGKCAHCIPDECMSVTNDENKCRGHAACCHETTTGEDAATANAGTPKSASKVDEIEMDIDRDRSGAYDKTPSPSIVDEEKSEEVKPSVSILSQVEGRKLKSGGVLTAIAMTLHNLPEGLFLTLSPIEGDAFGIQMMIAIALHHFPAGICIAVLIFYGGGSKHRAFLYATACGLTSLIGGFAGWIFLEATGNTDIESIKGSPVFGVLIGIVAATLIMVAIKELLPIAYKHDPEDKIASIMIVCGMVFMAISCALLHSHGSH